jgi:phosphoserine aminotransferase
MARGFNFCAGPAALPEAVLSRARDEMLDFNQLGMSVMEMSHRSDAFQAVAHAATTDLKTLLSVPDNYKILYMQGGATQQFSCVPWNLLGKNSKADYIDTGIWSTKAINEARRLTGADIHIAGSTQSARYVTVPEQHDLTLRPDAAYVHYTSNETIGGVEFPYIPDTKNVPLVADMSSNILSEPLDVSRFGLIYAGAQKNIGPAGLAWVLVRDDLLSSAREDIPALMSYQRMADNDSMLNTPPTFSLYLCGLVFAWLKEQGGVAAMAQVNAQKAALLYGQIDRSDFYQSPVAHTARSRMNVAFGLIDAALEQTFLDEAEAAGLYNLAGHRSVGGMRASIYNAVTLEAVTALTDFMGEFERRYG